MFEETFKGKFLVANKAITDPIFKDSVVYIVEYSEERGAQGIILNSQKEIGIVGFAELDQFGKNETLAPTIEYLKSQMSSGAVDSISVYLGGPCRTPGVYLLHSFADYLTADDLPNGSSEEEPEEESEFDLGIPSSFNLFDEEDSSVRERLMITDGIFFGSPATFCKIIEEGNLNSGQFRFFSGMAGWNVGQLEYEVEEGAWTVIDSQPELFFDLNGLNKLVKKDRGIDDWFDVDSQFDSSNN